MGKFAWGFNVSGGMRVLTILFLENENSPLDRETFVSKKDNDEFEIQIAWFRKLPGVEEVQPSQLDPNSEWEKKDYHEESYS